MPKGLCILPFVISFFFFFFFIFNDFSETNYLKIRWTDFRNIFTENESILGVDSDLDLLFDISRDVAMATDFVQKWGKITYTPAFIALSLRNAMGYRLADERIKSSTNCSTSCKKMVKIGAVVFELNLGRK